VDDFGAKLPVGGVAISGGLDPVRLHEVFALLMRPRALASEVPRLAAEWTKVSLGLSDIEIPEHDPDGSAS
jgi:hypothetical protein